ncbi:MliC family protein [Paragemmobacter ruber]|uniref:Lysozyme inhibitor n=1 Tax=Paragemmobacter ruber TaxID=1985673 RepID=A0ABW9Y9J7_9RHOB|nr:MliC family protein [Rhodobacter ruber]NBE08482.1 lysozyme inhibitor [Rhodobacter ruber]
MRRAVLALALMAGPALAETQVQNLTYACDRDVAVPVVYVNAPDTSLVVLHVEGRQILLYNEPAASGARYAWPSDGSGYVWWTKGEAATLLWKDGEAGTETPLLTCSPG